MPFVGAVNQFIATTNQIHANLHTSNILTIQLSYISPRYLSVHTDISIRMTQTHYTHTHRHAKCIVVDALYCFFLFRKKRRRLIKLGSLSSRYRNENLLFWLRLCLWWLLLLFLSFSLVRTFELVWILYDWGREWYTVTMPCGMLYLCAVVYRHCTHTTERSPTLTHSHAHRRAHSTSPEKFFIFLIASTLFAV